jgi:hypothetical protein
MSTIIKDKGTVIYHPVENKHLGNAVPSDLNRELIKYYRGLCGLIPKEGVKMLFVDNYSCCRTIAINVLFSYFDLIVYHDCEPEGAAVNGYVFDTKLTDNYLQLIYTSPRTWAGCFISNKLNPDKEKLQEKIKPITLRYLSENKIFKIQ